MQIIPVASGKGGVGKSLISANLAIALGQIGKKVILADLDLGASNLHLAIGQSAPRNGIGTWLTGNEPFENIITPTEYENVFFIAGDSEIPGLSALKAYQKKSLIKNMLAQDADYLIIDLGAGTHQIILDLFLLSPQGIIVTAPTVTATLNAYLFLKNAVFRLMYKSFKRGSEAQKWLTKLKNDSSSLQRLYIPKMVENIQQVDPQSAAVFINRMKKFHPRLIMNTIVDPKDADKAQKIKRSCIQYLGIDIEYLGIIYRDMLQDKALSSRLPIIIYKPHSVLSQAVYRIAEKVYAAETITFDDEYTKEETRDDDNSFEIALEEANDDYMIKMNGLEDLVGNGTLTMGELADTIKSQQYEITQLKKQNNLLKSKLVKAARQGFKI